MHVVDNNIHSGKRQIILALLMVPFWLLLAIEKRFVGFVDLQKSTWSGRQDSNLRPTVPKTVALPGCATPRLACLLTSSQKIEKRKDRFKRAIWPETVRNRRNVDRRRVQCWDARCDPPLICHILLRFQHVLLKHIEYQIPHQSTGSRKGLHHA